MRTEGWPERLDAVVARHRGAPFAWGETDCGTLFADCVAALTGEDHLSALRGYSSATGALRNLKREGFETCRDYVEAHFSSVPVVMAARGDLAFVEPGITHPLMSPCVLLGSVMVTRTEQEWLVLPRDLARTAYKVT